MSYSPYFLNRQGTGSVNGSRGTITNFQNGSGSTLNKATLVSVNVGGQLVVTTVSSETLVQSIVGMTGMSIPNSATGSVVDNGRLEDIATSFAIGDPIYLDKTGALSNVKPTLGVGGYNTDGEDAEDNSGAGGQSGGLETNGIGNVHFGAGGGAGGYFEAIITSPDPSYDYEIGPGGDGGGAGANGHNGGDGGSGRIIIEAYY